MHARVLHIIAAAAACRAAAPAAAGGGQYVANLLTVNFPKAVAKGFLDPGLELGAVPAGLVPDGMHPVIFCFGEQGDVGPTKWWYNEFIMSVPYAYVTETQKGPFNFATRLFLDNATHFITARQAIAAGWGYGIAKRSAHMSTTPVMPWGIEDHEYLINDRDDASKRFLTFNSHATTEWRTPSDFPNFAPVVDAIHIPNIGDTSMTGKDATGKWACFVFDWHLEHARVASIEGQLTINFAYVPGLPTGQHNFTGIADSKFGAYRLATNWTIGMPRQKCK